MAHAQTQQAAAKARQTRELNTKKQLALGRIVLRAAQAGKINLPDLIADAPERDRALFKDDWIPGGDWTPNATTIKAMEDARAGKGTEYETVEEMMKALNA